MSNWPEHHIVDFLQFVTSYRGGRYAIYILGLYTAEHLAGLGRRRVMALIHNNQTILINAGENLAFSIDGTDHSYIYDPGRFVRTSAECPDDSFPFFLPSSLCQISWRLLVDREKSG